MLVEASSMILPRPLAKDDPADMVRMTIDDNITAGNVAKMPAQNADPLRARSTAAPTTLPANNALINTWVPEKGLLMRPTEGILSFFSAKSQQVIATMK